MCDFCENIEQKQGRNFELYEVAIVYDTEEKEYSIADDLGEYIGIKYCPLCGSKLGEETESTSLRDRIIEKIKQTEPDYINYSDFYTKYGTLIPGIGDIWHWYENLTDEAKKEGFAQITDMSVPELFDLYARINEDWKKTHSNRFWEDYKKDRELEKQLKAIETEKLSTEEILTRLKGKMTEEDYKTLQNGMKSFSDGGNALWSVSGKGIETENQEG